MSNCNQLLRSWNRYVKAMAAFQKKRRAGLAHLESELGKRPFRRAANGVPRPRR